MGISPIEYRPWKGKRTSYLTRVWSISTEVMADKLTSKSIVIFLILGTLLVFAFPIISAVMLPHEDFDQKLMVGDGYGRVMEYEWETTEEQRHMEEASPEDRYDISGDIELKGNPFVAGNISLAGTVVLQRGGMDFYGGFISGEGAIDAPEDGITLSEDYNPYADNFTVYGKVTIYGMVYISGTVGSEMGGSLYGDNGTIAGNGSIAEKKVSMAEYSNYPQRGILNSDILLVVTIILSAIISSDLIAEDLRNNSFVLYMSRPLKVTDYVVGKLGGAMLTIMLFTTLMPVTLIIAMMLTQTGDDYDLEFKVLASTIAAGALIAYFYLPLGLLLSSFTKRSSYAAIGTFMTFFVLTIISGVFREFDITWILVNPGSVLLMACDLIYGYPLWDRIDPYIFAGFFTAYAIVPMAAVYYKIYVKAVGK